jgi:protein-tyrosine phosphatase
MLQVPDLLERASALGIETLWFPIRDGAAPRPEQVVAFDAMVQRVLEAAGAGDTVVIHCRGGLGRAGLVASACLVARGHPPAAAIEKVRAVRPDAVETVEQERWITKLVRF